MPARMTRSDGVLSQRWPSFFYLIKQDHIAICQVSDDAGIAIFGASTKGEIIEEETQIGSAAILLIDMNAEYFTILVFTHLA